MASAMISGVSQSIQVSSRGSRVWSSSLQTVIPANRGELFLSLMAAILLLPPRRLSCDRCDDSAYRAVPMLCCLLALPGGARAAAVEPTAGRPAHLPGQRGLPDRGRRDKGADRRALRRRAERVPGRARRRARRPRGRARPLRRRRPDPGQPRARRSLRPRGRGATPAGQPGGDLPVDPRGRGGPCERSSASRPRGSIPWRRIRTRARACRSSWRASASRCSISTTAACRSRTWGSSSALEASRCCTSATRALDGPSFAPTADLLETVDVWLLPDWLLGEAAWDEVRADGSRLVAMHLAAPTAPAAWFGSAGSLEQRVTRIREAHARRLGAPGAVGLSSLSAAGPLSPAAGSLTRLARPAYRLAGASR